MGDDAILQDDNARPTERDWCAISLRERASREWTGLHAAQTPTPLNICGINSAGLCGRESRMQRHWQVCVKYWLMSGMSFHSSESRSLSTARGCGARRWCRHLGRPPNTEPWSCHWNQWTLMKSKIPVTINIKIHANKAPATSFVYVLLWLKWWRFYEIKWFELMWWI